MQIPSGHTTESATEPSSYGRYAAEIEKWWPPSAGVANDHHASMSVSFLCGMLAERSYTAAFAGTRGDCFGGFNLVPTRCTHHTGRWLPKPHTVTFDQPGAAAAPLFSWLYKLAAVDLVMGDFYLRRNRQTSGVRAPRGQPLISLGFAPKRLTPLERDISMKASFFSAVVAFAAFGSLQAQPLTLDHARPLYEEGVVAVKLHESPSLARIVPGASGSGIPSLDDVLVAIGTTSLERAFKLRPGLSRRAQAIDLERIYYVYFDSDEDVTQVARRLSRDQAIEYAEPVPMNYSHGLPTDALYEFLQHLPQIKAAEAWAVHRGQDGGQDVIIAITDAGVEWYHPDLAANIWNNPGEDANGNGRTIIERDGTWIFEPGDLNGVDDDGNGYVDDLIGWNFSSRGSNDPNTGDDHGTHVAGIAGAMTDNGIGVASISHNVKLMPVSTFDSSCNCLPNAYQMLIYAAENGAHIINASWGGTSYSRANEEVIRYVRSLGSIVVSSAGNMNSAVMHYPDGYPGMVSVASVAVTDQKATYSSFGARVTVSAPGGQNAMFADGGILSTGNNGTYVRYQGTSMASPMVAGLLALVKSYRPEWTNEQVIKQVIGTADDLSAVNPAYPGMLGAGRINALRALTETELNLPRGLRLHLTESELYDESYDGLFAVGETGRLSVRLGNHALFVNAAELVLRLEADHDWIELLSPPVSTPLAYDGEVRATFHFRILPGATSGTFPIRLRASADVPVESGEVFEYEVTVAAGGVLVWDGSSDPRSYSGRFIYDFLTEQGVPAIYVGSDEVHWSSTYPSSLEPFDAVFMSFGSGEYNLRWMSGNEQSVLASYLQDGGKVYLEGSGILESSWSGPDLLSALGIAALEPGPSGKAAPEVLVGLEGSVLEGLVFPGYSQQPVHYPKRYTAGEGGIPALDEPAYGTVAVQGSGPSGRRSFVSSYALVNMADGSLPSHRHYFLMQLLDFFGIEGEAPFAHVGFSADVLTGHAPLTVQFTDRSTVRDTTPLREWDLTGDGHIDAVGEAVTWTYLEPATYPVRLRVTAEGRTRELERTGYVRVFGGNSALTFGAPAGKVVIPASWVSRLNLNAFTVEAWIRPDGWGLGPSGFGRIIDKQHVLLFVEMGGHLVLYIEHPDRSTSRLSTDAGTLTLGEWQHVAASYDGEGRVELLINGVPHPLNQAAAIPAAIRDNWSSNLYVGNNEANTRAFQGEVDEVRLWSGVRNTSQIQATMRAPLTGEEPGLIGYWPFDEGAGAVALDATPFRLHGTAADTEWRAGFMSNPVSVEEISPKPVVFALSQNYPNPFRSSTLITYHLTSDERVMLEVFNALGQRVALIVDERQSAGAHHITFEGQGLASGIYVYRLRTDAAVLARKMAVVR
jgi:serine protease